MLPIQNLNGYDHPWAAGGGKNLVNISFSSADSQNIDVPITVEAGDYVGSVFNSDGSETGLSRGTTYAMSFRDENKVNVIAIYNGATVTAEQAALIKYVRVHYVAENYSGSSSVLAAQLERGLTATSYAPYANICPIYGHTSATAYRTGKNLFGGIDLGNALYNASALKSIDTENKTVKYTRRGTNNIVFTFPFKPNTVYTVMLSAQSNSTGNDSFRIAYTDGSTTAVAISEIKDIYVVSSNPEKTVQQFQLEWFNAGETTVWYDESGIFEGALTAADFEPYQGDTYAVSFGETIYGGTLDFTKGVLTATWGYIASYNGETLPSEWISDRDVYAAGTTPTTGAEVAYRLATPQTIQLTPQEITTLYGKNNVWVTTTTNQP